MQLGITDFKAVLLDLDGVLLDYPTAERQAFAGVAMRLGLHDVDAALRIYGEINAGLWAAFERGEVTPEQLRVQRWEHLLVRHDKDPGGAVRVAERYVQLLGRSPAVLPGAVQALRHLSARLPVAAVTNGFARIARGRLTAAGVWTDLVGMVASDEVQAPKPDPAIFLQGLWLVGDPDPSRVLMIGDNHHADIVGAAGLGIKTAWVAGDDVTEPDPAVASMRAKDLAGVVAALGTG